MKLAAFDSMLQNVYHCRIRHHSHFCCCCKRRRSSSISSSEQWKVMNKSLKICIYFTVICPLFHWQLSGNVSHRPCSWLIAWRRVWSVLFSMTEAPNLIWLSDSSTAFNSLTWVAAITTGNGVFFDFISKPKITFSVTLVMKKRQHRTLWTIILLLYSRGSGKKDRSTFQLNWN